MATGPSKMLVGFGGASHWSRPDGRRDDAAHGRADLAPWGEWRRFVVQRERAVRPRLAAMVVGGRAVSTGGVEAGPCVRLRLVDRVCCALGEVAGAGVVAIVPPSVRIPSCALEIHRAVVPYRRA